MKTSKWALLATICVLFVFAFSLRIYRVGEVPPSLNWDEVSINYNAYSILKTGKDEWGKTFPLNFRSFGEYKLPAQIYASIPSVGLFGLNELGVRFTPAFYGALTVVVTFFLAKLLFSSNSVGVVAAFLLAISPWHLQLTRGSFESSLSMFFTTLGIYFFVSYLKKKSIVLILSFLFFGLSFWTYNAARVFVPLFLLFLVVWYRKKIFPVGKKEIGALLLLGLFFLPIVPSFFSGEASARLRLVSIVDDPGFVLRINEARGNLHLPSPLPRLVHNKATHLISVVSKNYLAHYSPSFLFLKGAGHVQHHVQGIGELYFFEAPFLLLGLYFLIRKKHKFLPLLVGWVLLSAVPVSVTVDSIPHALRTLLVLPSYQLLTGFGIIAAMGAFQKNWQKLTFTVALGVAAFVSFLFYLDLYYRQYPVLYSRDWQYGYKQVVEYIKKNQDAYDEVVVTRHYGEPHIFLLFYLQYDPALYQHDPNLVRYQAYDWVWVERFGKYYFPDLGDEGTQFEDIKKMYQGKKVLVVGKPGDFPASQKILYKVTFLNGNDAFFITAF